MSKAKRSILVILMSLAVLLTCIPTFGQVYSGDYFVSPEGSDNNPGTMEQPFKTIQKAADVVQPGDTVYIRGGTYHELTVIGTSGTENATITFQAYNDEVPVIDGMNTIPEGPEPSARYIPMISVKADYIEINGLTVTRSRGRGVTALESRNVVFSNLNVNNIWNAGLQFDTCSDSLIENCSVWECSQENNYVNRDGSNHPSIVMIKDCTNSIVKNSRIYHNWSQGLSDLGSQYSIFEDNEIYDNLGVNIYNDNSRDSITQRNIVYYSSDAKDFWGPDATYPRGRGISLANEDYTRYNNLSIGKNQIIANNFVFNCGSGFVFAPDEGIGSHLDHSLIAYNTFVDQNLTAIIIRDPRDKSNHINSRFTNNIVVQKEGVTLIQFGAATGVTYSDNCWSRQVHPFVSSSGDVIGDPRLARVGSYEGGKLTEEYFKLLSDSPAINKARVMAEVTEDFLKTKRGLTPDMGAYEYDGPIPENPPSTPKPTVSFKDVKPGDWFFENITFLVEKDVIGGYPDGTFKPGDNVNVDAFIKMIVTALGYTDITNSTGYWASNYISKAQELKLVFDQEFSLYNRPITRGEMARMIARALEVRGESFSSDLSGYSTNIKDFGKIQSGYGEYILKAFSKGIITGYPDGEFKDIQKASRAESATMIARLLDSAKRVMTVK